MYDTVNFWIDKADILGGDTFTVSSYLNDVTERHNNTTGRRSYSGRYDDYKIVCYEHGISLKGSLSQFYYQSNCYTLTRAATRAALDNMSDVLHIDMTTAKVTRLDFSNVILTQRPVHDYFSILGDKRYYTRLQATGNTLYYQTEKKKLAFYDKSREAKAKHKIIPLEWGECSNILRYELSFLKDVSKILKIDRITGRQLYDDKLYHKLVHIWGREFDTIKKINIMESIPDHIHTPKEVKDYLLTKFLQQEGQQIINDCVADLKAKKCLSAVSISRVKSDLNKLITAGGYGRKNDMVQELETAVHDIVENAE